jgi:hypothetical protein
MHYSALTRGFYSAEIHGGNMPADVVYVSGPEYKVLMDGQAAGREIVPGPDGRPVLADPAPVQLTQERVDALRKAAYQNEADPLFFKWQRGEGTEQQWLAKVAEIKARHPDV